MPTPIDTVKFEDLNTVLINYFKTILDSSDALPFFIENAVSSLLPNTVNGYQNSNLGNESFYSDEQLTLVNSIFAALKANDVEGIPAVLDDAENQIAQSGLSVADQSPLFVAVEIGRRSYTYWMDNIYDDESPWADLLNENTAINVANMPFWIEASIEGALSGFAQIQQLDMVVSNTLNSFGRSIAVTAGMLAAVGLSSGKILFKWAKQVNRRKLSLNRETVAILNETPQNGYNPKLANTWTRWRERDFDTPTINDACFSIRSVCKSGFTCGSGTFRAACEWNGFWH